MVRPSLVALAITTLALGCHGGGDTGGDDDMVGDDDGDAGTGADDPDAGDVAPDAGVDAAEPDAGPVDYPYSDLDVTCAKIFAQKIVPEYNITI